LTRYVLDTMSGRPPSPALPDRSPIRPGIADADQHHHLPLPVSPYGYATHRGCLTSH